MPTTGTIAGSDWVTVGGGGASIAYEWLADYKEESGPDGTIITASVQTEADLSIYNNFQATMLGTAQGSSAAIARTMPEPHPVRNWLYCTKCNLKGGVGYPDQSQNMLVYLDAADASPGKLLWEVEWSDLGYRVRNDADAKGVAFGELLRYITRKSTSGGESLAIPGTSWQFTTTKTGAAAAIGAPLEIIKEPTTKLLKSVQLEYKWWWVPEPLGESTWRDRMNSVNITAFDPLTPGANYDAETVLFTHYEKSDPVVDPKGHRCYHLTFYFLHRPTGWNSFYRHKGGSGPGFYYVVASDGTIGPDGLIVTPFPLKSLNGLFSA